MDVTLDEIHAVRLARMADRESLSTEALATSLLSSAIDHTDPDAATVTRILEGITGFEQRLRDADEDVLAGRFIDLDDL